MQASEAPPASSQKGLKESLIATHHFLACQCRADSGVDVIDISVIPNYVTQVHSIENLSGNTLRVLLKKPDNFRFRPGQFINLTRPSDNLSRPYSIASLYDQDLIELHIAQVPGGSMTNYLSTAHGELMDIRGPSGDCFYLEDNSEEPLLLIGTGTGLAPLMGILRSALSHQHRAPIFLYHGASLPSGLYLREELALLAEEYPTFSYRESVLSLGGEELSSEKLSAPSELSLFEQIKRDLPQLKTYRIYLCGHPDFVKKMKKQCFLAGASMANIHSDPFVGSGGSGGSGSGNSGSGNSGSGR